MILQEKQFRPMDGITNPVSINETVAVLRKRGYQLNSEGKQTASIVSN
jgi:hypothetical protein